MKTSFRMSFILSSISIVTLVILTVLMHFKYHITRSNLINDRIGVTMSSIASAIDNNLRMGIGIESQTNIQSYIDYGRKTEKIIDQIYVLKNNNWDLSTIFKTTKQELRPVVIERSIRTIKSAKAITWSFSEWENYVGLTLKDPTGAIRGAILISYKPEILAAQEKSEIENLYKRMAVAILVTMILSAIIGYKMTAPLIKTVASIQKNIDKLKIDDTHFDLSEISDPMLRGNFRTVVTSSTKMKQDLAKIEKLLNSTEKDTNHE